MLTWLLTIDRQYKMIVIPILLEEYFELKRPWLFRVLKRGYVLNRYVSMFVWSSLIIIIRYFENSFIKYLLVALKGTFYFQFDLHGFFVSVFFCKMLGYFAIHPWAIVTPDSSTFNSLLLRMADCKWRGTSATLVWARREKQALVEPR